MNIIKDIKSDYISESILFALGLHKKEILCKPTSLDNESVYCFNYKWYNFYLSKNMLVGVKCNFRESFIKALNYKGYYQN